MTSSKLKVNAGSQLTRLLDERRPYLRLTAEQAIGAQVRRREDASDIVQQTELEAFQSIQDFRGDTEEAFSAWILQILRRNLMTLFRTHQATKRDVRREQFLNEGEASVSLSWKQPAAAGPSPSERAVAGEAALHLATALESLPNNQREAVRMRHLDGMKIDDIATEMGVTAGAAAGLIRRGVEALRKKLTGDTSWL